MATITSIQQGITYSVEAVRTIASPTDVTIEVPREEVGFYRRVLRAEPFGLAVGDHRFEKMLPDGKRRRIRVVGFR